jgi:hypothetical protein
MHLEDIFLPLSMHREMNHKLKQSIKQNMFVHVGLQYPAMYTPVTKRGMEKRMLDQLVASAISEQSDPSDRTLLVPFYTSCGTAFGHISDQHWRLYLQSFCIKALFIRPIPSCLGDAPRTSTGYCHFKDVSLVFNRSCLNLNTYSPPINSDGKCYAHFSSSSSIVS